MPDPRAGIQMDKTALEPRIGVAWKPFGSQNTVVRGGYAIFHDSSWNKGAQGLWQNPPYYAESDAFAFGGACTFATAACATKYGLYALGAQRVQRISHLHRAARSRRLSPEPCLRRIRTSSRAEFSSSTSTWNTNCPARLC